MTIEYGKTSYRNMAGIMEKKKPTKNLIIQVEAEMHQKIKILASEKGVSMRRFLMDALNKLINQ